MAKHCRLCIICREDFGTICETRFFCSKLDRDPETAGHSIIVPKRHFASLFDLRKAEWKDLQVAIGKTTKALRGLDLEAAYRGYVRKPYSRESKAICRHMLASPDLGKVPSGYNFGVNEGKVAGRTISHLHLHVIPRYADDGEESERGVRTIIKNAKY
jgi:diadenosine tetraphosphate (Ap4A) HIT family hydrolase